MVTAADLPLEASFVRDVGKYDIYIDETDQTYAVAKVGKNAAKKAKKKATRQLDFASPPPRTPLSRMDYAQGVSPTLALVLVAVVQLLVIALSFGASGYSATACHAVSPSWACNSLGFTWPELRRRRRRPSTSTRAPTSSSLARAQVYTIFIVPWCPRGTASYGATGATPTMSLPGGLARGRSCSQCSLASCS